tara:strand:- start:3035 stop:3952 length:918 start_codon:yes stop_codon:yes gene_type:complete
MLKYILKRKYSARLSQLELDLDRPKERDRNYHFGGRSFYFFDFDDNVAYLPSSMFVQHRDGLQELELSTAEWAKHSHSIGKQGPYKDYKVSFDPHSGSYRRFRDMDLNWWQKKLLRKKQPFVEDMIRALSRMDTEWKGPSWHCFYHAVYNHRPISLITARGHSKETIREGISLFVKHGFLPHEPNYLAIYPVNDIATKRELGDYKLELSVPELKRAAIRASVEMALRRFGHNAPHRFGMSDDDKKNLAFIMDEMRVLKREKPNMSFFVINTHASAYVKKEILLVEDKGRGPKTSSRQLSLFDTQI